MRGRARIRADLKDASRWAGGAPLLEQREIAGLGQRMARAARDSVLRRKKTNQGRTTV